MNVQNSTFQKLSWCITKDHVAFLVVDVDDPLVRAIFTVKCFFVLFVSIVLSELAFWLVSVWLPISMSSWKARNPSCGCDASFSALERMQARYWSVESFWPLGTVPEQTWQCWEKSKNLINLQMEIVEEFEPLDAKCEKFRDRLFLWLLCSTAHTCGKASHPHRPI